MADDPNTKTITMTTETWRRVAGVFTGQEFWTDEDAFEEAVSRGASVLEVLGFAPAVLDRPVFTPGQGS